MDTILDVISYFHEHYPCKTCLSVAWVKDLMYLADWKSVLMHGSPITHVEWVFGDTGPKSDKIIQSIIEYKENNPFWMVDLGAVPDTMKSAIKHEMKGYTISSEVREVLDHVVTNTSDLDRNGLTKLVYSTFPMLSRPRYAVFDMENIAKEYAAFLVRIRPLASKNG